MERTALLMVTCLLAAACSGSEGAGQDAAFSDAAVSDTGGGAADSGAPDAGGGDAGFADGGGEPCEDEGAAECSEDAMTLSVCEGGTLKVTDCYRDLGMLCEAGACVEPWKYGAPPYSRCEGDAHATPETLAQKAAYYDKLAKDLHVHPQHNIINSVYLKEGVSEPAATWQDVERWEPGENDGLWGGAYIASQAFRYAAAGEQEALDNLKNTVKGMARQFEITGVPGLVTREYITPGVDGMGCPQDPGDYVPDKEKNDNKWLRMDDRGCVQTYDGTQWVTTAHCVDAKFAGYCWLDNVSKDEYSGHMLAIGAIGKLVDDAEVRGIAVDLATKVARHLYGHDMTFVDWDGRITEHGKIHPMALDDYPGFNASLALSWMKVGAALSGDAEIAGFYDNCLLQLKRTPHCLPYEMEEGMSYLEFLEDHVLYVTKDGCKDNYNNFNMIFMAVFNLLWYENRPEVRQKVQDVYETSMMQNAPDQEKQMIEQRNSFFNFAYAAMKRHGPGSTGPALQAVEDAVCTLRQYPASKAQASRDSTGYPFDCKGRLGGDLTAEPIPIYDQCLGIFQWTGDPYEMERCTADSRQVVAPVDYLLAYWMGRYFGFITAEM